MTIELAIVRFHILFLRTPMEFSTSRSKSERWLYARFNYVAVVYVSTWGSWDSS